MNTILALAWSGDDLSSFEVAANLAHDMSSHVIGLEPPSYRAVSVAWADVGMGGPFDMPMADDEEDRKRVDALRDGFFRAMDTVGVPRASSAEAQDGALWRELKQAAPLEIGSVGRAAELIIVPQPGGPAKVPESLFEGALFESGRPVLMVPAGKHATVGKHMVIAWNASTETARCVAMAMPLFRRAESIEVISVDGAMVDGPSSAELAVSLRRRGLKVTARHLPAGNKAPGPTIIEAAQASGADMIVKGAYTQSRLRQMIFGGLTRHLILSSPIPVLFSH
jgi:nucleotide-binding universal stress UspA family protein